MARDLSAALEQRGKASGKLSGIGFIMEGIGWNPVVDEFQSDMIWRDQTPEVEEWIEEFVRRRYGADVPEARGGYYYMSWRDHDGKRQTRSSRTTDKSAAG